MKKPPMQTGLQKGLFRDISNSPKYILLNRTVNTMLHKAEF